MSSRPPDRAPRRPWILAVAGLLVLILAVALLGRGDDGDAPAGPTAGTTSSPTPPPAPVPPVSVLDEAALTVPQELRAAHGSFFLEAGESYLVRFETSTVKPPEEPGLGMYLGITFGCSGADGGVSEWIGGTENLLPGEPATYRNQLLLSPDEDEVVTCSVRANAPYDDVASTGATVDLDIRWRVTRAEGAAVSTPAPARLPLTVDAGTRAVAFSQEIPLDDLAEPRVRMLSSLHVTTCTVVNGSREAGRTWCGPEDLHEAGSAVGIQLRLDVLGADGEVCGRIAVADTSESVTLERHHRLLALEETAEVPASVCGERLRAAVVVENRGPASLVVHAANSSLITLSP